MIRQRSPTDSTSAADTPVSRRKEHPPLSSSTTPTRASSSRDKVGNKSSLIAGHARPPRSPRRSQSGFEVDRSRLRGVTLNIGAAAAPRAGEILDWLGRRLEDVIVLTETSPGTGTERLAEGLARRGYEIIGTPASNDRGVLIATRI